MPETFVTIKTTPDVLQKLRLVAAKTGEKQYEVLRRIMGLHSKTEKIAVKDDCALSVGTDSAGKYVASVFLPNGRRVKAGTFQFEREAWTAAQAMAKTLRGKAEGKRRS